MDAESSVIVLTVAYNGAPFAGFARQAGVETVQGRLESALHTLMRIEVETTGAGRTDSGVHALGQVMSFASPHDEIDPVSFAHSLTALAGPDIVVRQLQFARRGFSARFDALAREYRYLLVPRAMPPLFLEPRSWWVKSDLDLSAMREGASHLLGEHDFKSFCVAQSADGKRTVRRIDELEILEAEVMGEECVVVRVVGNAFLHSMVRVIVGTLVEVGVGRREPDQVAEVLHACDRARAGRTAPAKGLTLWAVRYPDEVWL